MSDRANILRLATAEVGYKEGANNSNKYGAAFGGNYQPWCAYFISWLAQQAGILLDIIPQTGYVPDYHTKYRANFKKKAGYTPEPGDLIIFDFNNNGTGDHVGIVEKVNGNTLTTIEGNTSSGNSGSQTNGGGVYRRTRYLSSSTTMGFWQPNYQEDNMQIRDLAVKDLDTGNNIIVKAGLQDNENFMRFRDVEKLAPVKIGYDAEKKMPTVELIVAAADSEYVIAQLQALIDKLKQG